MTSLPPLSTKRWFHDPPLIECDDRRQRMKIVFQTWRKYANSYFWYVLYNVFTVSFTKNVPHLGNWIFVLRLHIKTPLNLPFKDGTYTKDQAISYCEEFISNNTASKHCMAVLNSKNYTSQIESCAEDLRVCSIMALFTSLYKDKYLLVCKV